MKKYLMGGAIIAGLIIMNSAMVLACGQDKSKCPYAAKAQKNKVSILKNKVKPLWVNKDVLGINEDQLAEIKDIKHAAIKELIQLDADRNIAEVDLKAAMRKDSVDVKAVNKIIDAKYQAKNKTAKVYVNAISNIQKVLSEDQRNQWSSMSSKADSGGTYCAKCNTYTFDKICPISGKSLNDKGSAKGSEKGSPKGSVK